MNSETISAGKPNIIVRGSDYGRLSALAQASMDKDLALGEELMGELERAAVVVDDAVALQTVQMGSTVTYTTETGHMRTVTLVYPGEANIETSRISIMTPIGVALLGLSENQSINWIARDGLVHSLTITKVVAT